MAKQSSFTTYAIL